MQANRGLNSPAVRPVVLLGAGASVEAGLKTSASLTRAIYEDLRSTRQHKEYANILAFIISRLKSRNVAKGLSPYLDIEVEELFDALNLIFRRETLLISQFVERWDRSLDNFDQGPDYTAIQKHLSQIIKQHIGEAAGRRASFISSDYQKLTEAIKPRSLIEKNPNQVSLMMRVFFSTLIHHLTIDPGSSSYLGPLCDPSRVSLLATLNYDMSVEDCCKSNGVAYDYGLTRWANQKRVDWRNKGELRFLKLHGSLNWVGSPELIDVKDDVAKDINDYSPRVMIFGGTDNKLSADGPFLQFLYRLERALLTTGSLIVIGYSFRDAHINALINRWALTRRQSRLVVVDPGELQVPIRGGKRVRKVGSLELTHNLVFRHIKDTASSGIRQFEEMGDGFFLAD